ncbi:hypothetical protein RhiirC2_795963, partial [Rhizophagus irregularis]
MSSELELSKQRIIELEARNDKLEAENAEIPDLRRKISEFDAERAELKRRNAEFLRANEEYNERRDAKVKKLEQKNAELEARLAVVEKSFVVVDEQPQNNKEAIPEVLPEISASNNNADIKPLEDKKTDSFLYEVNKEKVSNEFRQRNRGKKLLRESSTKDLSRDVFAKVNPASPITQDKESRSHKKKEAENIVQD